MKCTKRELGRLIIRESLVQIQLVPLQNQKITKKIFISFLFYARIWGSLDILCWNIERGSSFIFKRNGEAKQTSTLFEKSVEVIRGVTFIW